MKKSLASVLIVAVTALVVTGASIGIHTALKDKIVANDPGQAESVPVELPVAIRAMFASDAPTSATELTAASATYIQKVYSVVLSDKTKKAYYYDLDSKKGFAGRLEFAIGVINGTVAYYKYIANINEDDRGNTAASQATNLFVGYTLNGTSENLITGTSLTYNGMLSAVNAALNDIASR
jgi:Na+-translocating ferredoxin:NAD+ oxidoreductase RnfG subunit